MTVARPRLLRARRGPGPGCRDEVVEIITSRGGGPSPTGDVSNSDDVDSMVAAALDHFGQLDIVVNSTPASSLDRVIWNMDVEDFDLVMAVHVRGTWLLSRAAANTGDMAKASAEPTVYGRLINTTSGAGLSGNFGQSNYAAAKAAIVGMTLTISLELANIGVTANVIGPGGLARISSTMPGSEPPKDFDPTDDSDFDRSAIRRFRRRSWPGWPAGTPTFRDRSSRPLARVSS